MLAEGYFWSAEQGFGHETRSPAQWRSDRAGGDGGGDGDVSGGDYHVLLLLRARLSLSLLLFALSPSGSF